MGKKKRDKNLATLTDTTSPHPVPRENQNSKPPKDKSMESIENNTMDTKHNGKEKKKKKKQKNDTSGGVSVSKDNNVSQDTVNTPEPINTKKEKKKKKKQMKTNNAQQNGSTDNAEKQDEMNTTETHQEETSTNLGESQKKKKKNKKNVNVENISPDSINTTDKSTGNVKLNKKKRKLDKPENDSKDIEEDSSESKKKKKKSNTTDEQSVESAENSFTEIKDMKKVGQGPKGNKGKKGKQAGGKEKHLQQVNGEGLNDEDVEENSEQSALTEGDEADLGQWSTAAFENSERQQKFFKLLGGEKQKDKKISNIQKKLFSIGMSDVDEFKSGGGQAMNHTQQNDYMDNMENEFDRARQMNFKRGRGFGYKKPAWEGKKFHIDTGKTKSMKFDD